MDGGGPSYPHGAEPAVDVDHRAGGRREPVGQQQTHVRATGMGSRTSHPSGARSPHACLDRSKPGMRLAAIVFRGPAATNRSRRRAMASELALIAARVLRTSGLPAKRRPGVAPAASTPALAGPRRASQRPAARVSRRSHARCRAALPDQQQADAGQNSVGSAGDGQFLTQHGQSSAGRGDRQQARAHHQQHQVGLAQRASGRGRRRAAALTNTSVASRSKLASSEPIGPHSAATGRFASHFATSRRVITMTAPSGGCGALR